MRHQLTREECRQGGKTRAAQPSFRDLQRARGRKGAATLLAQPGGRERLLGHVAAYNRAHPTAAEQWVAAALQAFGLAEDRDYQPQALIQVAGRACLVDFLIGRLCIEPGARRWHGTPAETLDGQDHAAAYAARDRLLAAAGYTVLRLDAAQIQCDPDGCTAQLQEALDLLPTLAQAA